NTRIWNTKWAFTPFTRYRVDNLDIADSQYGLFLPAYDPDVTTGRGARNEGNADWGRMSFHRTFAPIHMPAVKQLPVVGPFHLMDFGGDFLPPTTVITHARRADGKLIVRGTAADNEGIRRVTVNGKEARPQPVRRVTVNDKEARALAANFAEWEVTLDP